MMENERSGRYLKCMCSSKISTLCMMAKTKRLANSIIKIVIRPIWPRKKDIKFRNVFYICEKVRQMLPLLDYNAGYNSFSEIFNNRILLDGIDDQIELDDDLAKELAKDI